MPVTRILMMRLDAEAGSIRDKVAEVRRIGEPWALGRMVENGRVGLLDVIAEIYDGAQISLHHCLIKRLLIQRTRVSQAYRIYAHHHLWSVLRRARDRRCDC